MGRRYSWSRAVNEWMNRLISRLVSEGREGRSQNSFGDFVMSRFIKLMASDTHLLGEPPPHLAALGAKLLRPVKRWPMTVDTLTVGFPRRLRLPLLGAQIHSVCQEVAASALTTRRQEISTFARVFTSDFPVLFFDVPPNLIPLSFPSFVLPVPCPPCLLSVNKYSTINSTVP